VLASLRPSSGRGTLGPTVDEVSGEQLGTALRRLVQELVSERRRVVLLERENRELRAQIEAVETALRDHDAYAEVG
jgi:hypothetical protein